MDQESAQHLLKDHSQALCRSAFTGREEQPGSHGCRNHPRSVRHSDPQPFGTPVPQSGQARSRCLADRRRERAGRRSEPPGETGSRDWTRTSNRPINSRMLCQLSYAGKGPANRTARTGYQARSRRESDWTAGVTPLSRARHERRTMLARRRRVRGGRRPKALGRTAPTTRRARRCPARAVRSR